MKKKRVELLPRRRTGDPRASVAAFVVQVLLLAIIVPAFLVPVALDFMRDDSGASIVPERISFEVRLPTDGEPQREPAREGGDNRTASDEPYVEAAPIVAPTELPGALPSTPSVPREPSGGSGPIIGGGGPLSGIQPTFTDQRLWVDHSNVVIAPIVPLSRSDTLRQRLAERIVAVEDSLMRLFPEGARRPGDWTVNLGGKKYGVDPGFIRLGNFRLPTAVLAALPMNVQANPIAMERARRLDAMRNEIQLQAARSYREDEFYAAVRALRERKERERRDREAILRGGTPAPVTPGAATPAPRP
jgi:hypothetical protein